MLTSEEIDELYNVAYSKARDIAKSYGTIPRNDFKQKLFIHMKYHYINRYGNLGPKLSTANRRYQKIMRMYEHPKLARLFKNKSFDLFNIHLDEETMMLESILNKITNEHFSEEDKAIFDIHSTVESMSDCLKSIEKINFESEVVTKELAKVPNFIETGKWE